MVCVFYHNNEIESWCSKVFKKKIILDIPGKPRIVLHLLRNKSTPVRVLWLSYLIPCLRVFVE
jgi:hypothetical protein